MAGIQIKIYEACQDLENMMQNEEKMKSIETVSEMTQMIELDMSSKYY